MLKNRNRNALGDGRHASELAYPNVVERMFLLPLRHQAPSWNVRICLTFLGERHKQKFGLLNVQGVEHFNPLEQRRIQVSANEGAVR